MAWKKEDSKVKENTLKMRKWLLTPAGITYKEKRKKQNKIYRKRNKKDFNASQKKAYDSVRIEMITHYSKGTMECACCGETGIVFLSLDHIHGNGAAERRKIEKETGYRIGGNTMPYYLKKKGWPKGYQILCYNCNFAKRTNKKCPHQTGEVAIPIREPK